LAEPLRQQNGTLTAGWVTKDFVSNQVLDISIPSKHDAQHLSPKVVWREMGLIYGAMVPIRHVVEARTREWKQINTLVGWAKLHFISQAGCRTRAFHR
jgi:hypothetical protein